MAETPIGGSHCESPPQGGPKPHKLKVDRIEVLPSRRRTSYKYRCAGRTSIGRLEMEVDRAPFLRFLRKAILQNKLPHNCFLLQQLIALRRGLKALLDPPKVASAVAAVSLLLFLSPTVALAWCSDPSGSLIMTPSKSTVPWCVNEWNGTHTCSDWEIQSYYSDLEEYRSDVDRFIKQLNDYVDDAIEYAQCRAKEVD